MQVIQWILTKVMHWIIIQVIQKTGELIITLNYWKKVMH